MSIVTLKKKSQATHFKISNKKGFNLNGNNHIYSSSFVGGSSSFNNSKNKTRFKGIYGIGHGGCCGKYNHNVSNSGYCYNQHDLQTNKFGKPSVKNTKGYLNKKNYWLNSPYPCNIVQPVNNIKSYTTYYSELKNCNGCKVNQNQDSGLKCNTNTDNKPLNMSQIKKNINVNNYNKTIYPLSQEQYITTNLKCNKCLPPPPDKREFPLAVNNSGCNIKLETKQEALDLNLY